MACLPHLSPKGAVGCGIWEHGDAGVGRGTLLGVGRPDRETVRDPGSGSAGRVSKYMVEQHTLSFSNTLIALAAQISLEL